MSEHENQLLTGDDDSIITFEEFLESIDDDDDNIILLKELLEAEPDHKNDDK